MARRKDGALAGFYRYAISRGYASRSPLPAADEEPREPEINRPPYIYSREELQRLFEADRYQQQARHPP